MSSLNVPAYCGENPPVLGSEIAESLDIEPHLVAALSQSR